MISSFPYVPIGDMVDRVENWDPANSSADKPFRYIDISSVDREAKEVLSAPFILPKDAPSRARQLVKSKDVLVSTVRPNLNAVAQVQEELDRATASTGICVLRPNEKKLNSRYLYFWVRSPEFIADMIKKSTGASYPAVSDSIVRKSKIPLLPLDEQRRIAAILDKGDAIRRKRQKAISLTEGFLRSTFLEMFGDPVTNQKKWPVEPLENLVKFTTGKLDSNAAVESGTYPFFTCSREDYKIDTFAFDCEALLLAGNNASADYSVKHYKGKFNAYQRTYVITMASPDLSYRYMQYALEMKLQEMKKMSKGTNTKYLTLGILNQLLIQVPEKNVQVKFESIKNKFVSYNAKLTNALAVSNNAFDSFVYRAFRGELR